MSGTNSAAPAFSQSAASAQPPSQAQGQAQTPIQTPSPPTPIQEPIKSQVRSSQEVDIFGRGPNYEPPQTVTAQERLQLMRERATPAPQQHLRPKNVDHAKIDYHAMRLKERRIHHIETRLRVVSLGLKRAHLKAFNKDRAKVSFNKIAPEPLGRNVERER